MRGGGHKQDVRDLPPVSLRPPSPTLLNLSLTADFFFFFFSPPPSVSHKSTVVTFISFSPPASSPALTRRISPEFRSKVQLWEISHSGQTVSVEGAETFTRRRRRCVENSPEVSPVTSSTLPFTPRWTEFKYEWKGPPMHCGNSAALACV